MEPNQNKKDQIRWKILKFKLLEDRIGELFKEFRENGIEPILIKGWAAGQYYPDKFERVFSDIDFAVPKFDYDSACKLVKSKNLIVDLHKGLEKFGLIDWDDIYKNTKTEKVGECEFRVLRPEDHLVVLSVHWLTDGGIYKDKLKDISYLIDSFEIDWSRVFSIVSKNKHRWIMVTVALAEKYFGINKNNKTPDYFDKSIPVWILNTIEKEWKINLPLRPLQTCLSDRRMLYLQILKRIPPNPIQATVELDGEFNEKSRWKYQFKSTLNRVIPSLKRIIKTLFTGEKY